MSPSFTQKFDQLDSDLDSLFARLTAYPDHLLNESPQENEWSVLQILHHMKMAEKGSLSYVQKKLSYNPSLKKAGYQTHFKRMALFFFFSLPIKIKAPAAISGDALPEKSSLKDLISEWKDQRIALKIYLESLPEELFKMEIYKHPFGGRLDLAGMIAFFQSHFNRHQKQILRTLRKLERRSK
jgi:hypothetical protein